jgi:hypothetical protein
MSRPAMWRRTGLSSNRCRLPIRSLPNPICGSEASAPLGCANHYIMPKRAAASVGERFNRIPTLTTFSKISRGARR